MMSRGTAGSAFSLMVSPAVVCGQYTGWGGGLLDYDNDGRLELWTQTTHSRTEIIIVLETTEIEERLPYPVFVKPANMGSSVGVSKVHDRGELSAAMDLAAPPISWITTFSTRFSPVVLSFTNMI